MKVSKLLKPMIDRAKKTSEYKICKLQIENDELKAEMKQVVLGFTQENKELRMRITQYKLDSGREGSGNIIISKSLFESMELGLKSAAVNFAGEDGKLVQVHKALDDMLELEVEDEI